MINLFSLVYERTSEKDYEVAKVVVGFGMNAPENSLAQWFLEKVNTFIYKTIST